MAVRKQNFAFSVCLMAAACAGAPNLVVAAECSFARPADLAPGATTWLGACPHGQAEGPGALRVTNSAGPFFFFGTMRDGAPQRGVVTLDINDTVVAWRFEGARAVPPADRAQTQVIYDMAAAAAAAVSQSFAGRQNLASARYYANWRDALKIALDRPE